MRFKGVSDAKGLEVRLDNIFINDCKLFVNLPRFDRPVRNTELQKKNPIGRKYTDEASKPCGVTTGALRRSYVDVVTKGGCQGDKRTDEAQTPTILINPDEGGEYWCNETWVGMLKKVMEVETLEDRITWELGYNVRTKFLGDDMVLLPGMSDDKAQLLIQSETESDDSLFYSLEKWTPKCRPNNRVVWLQLWGFLIQVWEMKNIRRAVAAIGDVIESDDDTEDRRRLDRARVLVRTPLPPFAERRGVARAVGDVRESEGLPVEHERSRTGVRAEQDVAAVSPDVVVPALTGGSLGLRIRRAEEAGDGRTERARVGRSRRRDGEVDGFVEVVLLQLGEQVGVRGEPQ